MNSLDTPQARAQFDSGLVIPAMPLALSPEREFDPVGQRAVLRYYVDAAVGGLAVGVHSTQFAVRDTPGFYQRILHFARDTVAEWAERRNRPMVMIAGICGGREQALSEARLARSCGYHAGLLSLAALKESSIEQLVAHADAVSQQIPLIGFYLQPAVGGMMLPYDFWRRFAALQNVWGVKIAPFDRYATLAVLRGIADSGRADDVALYTGNDDSIVTDLLTPFRFAGVDGVRGMRISGGLLGHWGVWTRRAVEIHQRCRKLALSEAPIPAAMLTLAAEITDMNGAVFDAAHGYAGCLPGVHEVLHRQGIFGSITCLDPDERLSPGQADEITRVCSAYPHLTDDDFVQQHLAEWRS
ncbi:MAG: dihydrodipicolinate synthase family protein [Spirochaetaceae bacterium]|nr:MAG: dihydrodipicolinate synthase family protein [Spirochaetaceae bacterium]